MAGCCPVSTPMLEKEKTAGKETMILLNDKEKARPDIAYSVIKLSQYSSKPEQHHWEGVKRILRYIKGLLKAGIVLGNRKMEGELEENEGLVGYFDAAHADTPSMHSTYGYIFLLCGSPIS